MRRNYLVLLILCSNNLNNCAYQINMSVMLNLSLDMLKSVILMNKLKK